MMEFALVGCGITASVVVGEMGIACSIVGIEIKASWIVGDGE